MKKRSPGRTLPRSESSEEPFRLLFHHHPHPMWVYNLKTLAFLDVNDAAVKKYGYTRDEFLRMSLKDIRPSEGNSRLPEDAERKRPPLQQLGGWHHMLKNGHIIDVEITSHTLEYNGQPAALVIAQDITERKRAEERLALLAHTIRSIGECVSITDTENKILFVNEAFLRTYGYTADELIGKSITVVRSPRSEPAAEKVLSMTIEGSWQGELVNRKKMELNF